MENFSENLTSLFLQNFTLEFRRNYTCKLACKILEASSVSIFAYSGKHDNLISKGFSLNSNKITTGEHTDQSLSEVIKYYDVCEFIDIKKQSENINNDILYSEYINLILDSASFKEEIFHELVQTYDKWKITYRKFKDYIKNETYEIDNSSITGSYYNKLLKNGTNYVPNVCIHDLRKVDDRKKYFRKYLLENDISSDNMLYIGLPLFANGRYFGVLRVIFSEFNLDLVTINKEKLNLNDVFKRNLLYIAEVISLHLENNYLIESYRRLNRNEFKAFRDDQKVNYLKMQCEDISKIIYCKGAIVRSIDVHNNYNIISYSESMGEYVNFSIKNKKSFSGQLIEKLEESNRLLAVYFNCYDYPFIVNKCFLNENSDNNIENDESKWYLEELNDNEFIKKLKRFNIANIAILPVPNIKSTYMIFFNSKNRPFLKKDIELLYNGVIKMGLYLSAIGKYENVENEKQRLKMRMETIDSMHDELHKIMLLKNINAHKAVKKFTQVLSETFSKFTELKGHILWEYISEHVPYLQNTEQELLFLASQVKRNNLKYVSENLKNKILSNNQFIYHPKLDADDYKNYTENFFQDFELKRIFTDIPMLEGYINYEIPLVTKKSTSDNFRLLGLVTLIFSKKEYENLDKTDYLIFLDHLVKQIDIAWGKLQEEITINVQEKIDETIISRRSPKEKAISVTPKSRELKQISGILAKEFKCDLCCFFVKDSSKNALVLEASNIPLNDVKYDLNNKKILSVLSFKENRNFRIFSRQRVEKFANLQKLREIESQISSKNSTESRDLISSINFREGDFYNEICIEHWLSVVIEIAEDKLGLIKLFQIKGLKKKEQNNVKTKPFSEFETGLLEQIQEHLYNVIISLHFNELAIQQRTDDMQNVLHQVIAPINALSISCDNIIKGRIPKENLNDKLKYISILASLSAKYAVNYQKILDIDSKKVVVRTEIIEDLVEKVIGTAIDFQPMALEDRGITIHVMQNDKNKISLRTDIVLFDHLLINLLDNAVKYSFDSEKRINAGYQAIPKKKHDMENVVIQIEEIHDEIIISMSNLGYEIMYNERAKIFNRDYRGILAKDAKPNGSGIGLFLVKEILKLFNGEIKLVSKENKNLIVFKVKIPKGV
ncbi:MAG: HAMP domain-containing histidine kinase [Ignavibacteria bacterium]|nr:HAMP domain-containing histidine kinase [Ignavibacteria bacterium]